MRNYLVIAVAIAASSGAYAQAASDHNPALNDPSVHTMPAIASGRNSFTESQAQGRITKAGYTSVGKLTKDANGVWQGKAMKDGKAVSVSLDYKGDVAVR